MLVVAVCASPVVAAIFIAVAAVVVGFAHCCFIIVVGCG